MNIFEKFSEWREDQKTKKFLDTKEKRRILLEKRNKVRQCLIDSKTFLNRSSRERAEKVLSDINEKLNQLKE